MKAKHFFILFLLLSGQWLFSQKWNHTFGENNRYDMTSKIIQTYDGGTLLASRYYYKEGSTWYSYGWLIKTDANGNLLWDKMIDFPGRHYFKLNSIVETYDQGYVIVGWISTETPGIIYPIAFKLSSCLAVEWCHIYVDALNNTGTTNFKDVIELSDHSLIIYVYGYGEIDFENSMLFKLNEEGELLWKKVIGSGYEYPILDLNSFNIMKDDEDNIFIPARGYWNSVRRPIGIKTDNEGNELWVTPIGVNGNVTGGAISSIFSPEEIIMFGYGIKNSKTVDWTIKLSNDGEVLDDEIHYPTEFNPNFKSYFTTNAYMLNDTSVFKAGPWTYEGLPSWDSPPTLVSTMKVENLLEYDLIIEDSIVNNSLFAVGEQHQINSDSTQILSTYDIPNDYGEGRNIYFTKYNSDLTEAPLDNTPHLYDTACPFGIQSGFIVLDQWVPVGAKETPTPRQYHQQIQSIPLEVFPNPASNLARITLKNTLYHHNILLEVNDIMGRPITQQKIQSTQEETTLDVSSWQEGIYFVIVRSEGKIVGYTKLIVK